MAYVSWLMASRAAATLEPADSKEDEDDDPKAWTNQALCLSIWEATWLSMYQVQQCLTWLLGVKDFSTKVKVPTSSCDMNNEGVV
jgi:hypothetical protein